MRVFWFRLLLSAGLVFFGLLSLVGACLMLDGAFGEGYVGCDTPDNPMRDLAVDFWENFFSWNFWVGLLVVCIGMTGVRYCAGCMRNLRG